MEETLQHSIALPLIAIALFLLISAFFSAAETALTALSRARLFSLVKEGNKRAATVSRLRARKESLIGTVLIGNNIVNTAISTLATSLMIGLFGDNNQVLVVVTLAVALLIIIFSEILPKTYAFQNAERVSLFVAPLVSVAVKILSPATHAIQFFIKIVLKLFGVDITRSSTLISATDVIRGTVELHHREGKLVKQDADMLGSILDLNDITVSDIMIHRTQVDRLNISEPVEALVQNAVGMLHSRIPLWRDNPDNIVAVLHVKDLIKTIADRHGEIDNTAILRIAKEPWFIPETTSLRDQLVAFRNRKQHFALVVDEYGAFLGIVTLEDIIEEIVGDIHDEHDEARRGIVRVDDRVFILPGELTIRDVNREMDWNLPDENASTLAGLVVHEARSIPARGARIEAHGFRFTVLERSTTQVKRLRVEKLQADTPEDEEDA